MCFVEREIVSNYRRDVLFMVSGFLSSPEIDDPNTDCFCLFPKCDRFIEGNIRSYVKMLPFDKFLIRYIMRGMSFCTTTYFLSNFVV